MGLFDTVRSSYNLGPGFANDLQTKDLECCMCEYWISPNGELYEIDYSGTQDFVEPDSSDSPWRLFKTVKNGNHGKVIPCQVTATVIVYPSKWTCYYSPFPEKKILFVEGKIYKVIDIEKKSLGL